jgi:hypothetical protein
LRKLTIALSFCRSRTAVKGISLRAIATALTKTREELERQGLAAIWFEVVNSHNGGCGCGVGLRRRRVAEHFSARALT